MRFALPACKFEGLQLCHQFFNDLMSLVEPISLNVAKEEMKINHEKDPEGLHSRVPHEALQITLPTKEGPVSVIESSHQILMDLLLLCIYFYINEYISATSPKIFSA